MSFLLIQSRLTNASKRLLNKIKQGVYESRKRLVLFHESVKENLYFKLTLAPKFKRGVLMRS